MGTGLAQPSIDIIIVNWNTGTLLRDCLESISQARPQASVSSAWLSLTTTQPMVPLTVWRGLSEEPISRSSQ